MSQKRILFFSLTYHPFIGGAEVAIKEVTDRISDVDYHFDMITLRLNSDLPKFERFGNVDIFRIGFTIKGASVSDAKRFPLFLNKYLYPFWACLYALVLHRRKKYDAIATVMTSYASFAALFFKLLKPKIPYILRSDDGDPYDHYKKRAAIVGPLFSLVFKMANIVVTTANHLSGFGRSLGYKGRVVVVPNGVNYKHFSQNYSSIEIDEIKNKLQKKEGDVFLITTSRLVKKNGIDDVIRAMKFLPSNVYFLVYGLGPDLDMLKNLTKSEGVEGKVRFLGQLAHAEMPKYLKSCDIFIRPSLSEGFGISFVEAMAAEVPVIATQVGGIADFLYDPEINSDKEPTGRAVKVHDPEGVARQVRAYLENPELTKRIIVNAKRLVFERYDWNLIAKQMKENVFDYVFK
jgi:glycosyltransferase involved in cell wall biosynthesis